MEDNFVSSDDFGGEFDEASAAAQYVIYCKAPLKYLDLVLTDPSEIQVFRFMRAFRREAPTTKEIALALDQTFQVTRKALSGLLSKDVVVRAKRHPVSKKIYPKDPWVLTNRYRFGESSSVTTTSP
jgi:hypothetical protein